MAENVLVDAGFVVALLSERDANHRWADDLAKQYPPPWVTCEAVATEAFYLSSGDGGSSLIKLLQSEAVVFSFHLQDNTTAVLALMQKYADVPMSLADACLVRMTELLADPLVLTTDSDFRIYRRHSRQTIPARLPSASHQA